MAVITQSGVTPDCGGGTSPLLHIGICWIDSNGIGDGCCPFWLNVIEIPASVVGNGKPVALTGGDDKTVFNPVTNNVVIWPGATRMIEGLEYPVPAKVGPCPNNGPRLIGKRQSAVRSVRRIDSPVSRASGITSPIW
jgi:hypothetical protein